MAPIPHDTHPDAAQRMIELLRRASPSRRAALALSLSQTAMDLCRRALTRRMRKPDAREVGLAFVALNYGEDLARKVRARLEEE